MENQVINYISQFMTLTKEEEQAIISLNLFKNYNKGTVLLKEGDYSDENYFVIKGCLRSYCIIDGEEKTTEFYTEAESLVPFCSTTKESSKHYIVCAEDCLLSVGTSEMETEIFEKFPRFESLCRVLSEKLLVKNQINFEEYKNSTPEERYLNLIKNRPDLIQRVPQHQIASYLGLKPESLSRLRKRLSIKK